MKQSSVEFIEQFKKENPALLEQAGCAGEAVELLAKCYHSGGKVLVCGNGGSASDSEHIVGELMKGFIKKRPLDHCELERLEQNTKDEAELKWMGENLQRGLPAISLVSQSALLTAFANDAEPKLVFAQQVMGYGQERDIFIGLSTSGNSENVVYGAKAAKSQGMDVISFTGARDSRLSEISSVVLRSNETETYKVQEEHIKLYHLICAVLENEMFER